MTYTNWPEFKAAWLAALRSGEYTQGMRALRTGGNGFCCLGVAADLLVKSGYGQWSDEQVPYLDKYRFDYTREDGAEGAGISYSYNVLNGLGPDWLDDWLRKEVPNGYSCEQKLVALNDSGDTFERIANWIEENDK